MTRNSTTYQTPRTRTEALRYCGAVSRNAGTEKERGCEHGHYGCALWEGGPCADEVSAQFDIRED